jgi:hypothetical protein
MGRTVWKPALDTTSIPTFAVNLGLPFYIVTVMRKLLHTFMECCAATPISSVRNSLSSILDFQGSI